MTGREGPQGRPILPHWPQRTVAILSTLGEDGPHAIPVSAPVRGGDDIVLLALHRDRDSLARLAANDRVALTVLADGDVAFTARGRAAPLGAPSRVPGDYVAVVIETDRVDDHRQAAFTVTSGVSRAWLDDAERRALGDRVAALQELVVRRSAV